MEVLLSVVDMEIHSNDRGRRPQRVQNVVACSASHGCLQCITLHCIIIMYMIRCDQRAAAHNLLLDAL